jgi:hypothetical protein
MIRDVAGLLVLIVINKVIVLATLQELVNSPRILLLHGTAMFQTLDGNRTVFLNYFVTFFVVSYFSDGILASFLSASVV